MNQLNPPQEGRKAAFNGASEIEMDDIPYREDSLSRYSGTAGSFNPLEITDSFKDLL